MWIAVLLEIKTVEAKLFVGKSSVITDIINRNLALNKVKLPGVRKITISLTSASGVNSIEAPMKGVSPVVNIRKSYDFSLFNSSPNDSQNELILMLIETSLQEACEKFNWDFGKFGESVNQVRKVGFKQKYLVGKVVNSKDKKSQAAIEIEMLIDEARLSIIFYDHKSVVVKKVHLISVRPSRFFIVPLLGKSRWLNDTDFELSDKKAEIHFKASLLKDAGEVSFTPINRDVNPIIDELLILSTSTSDIQAISLLKEKINRIN